MDPVCIGLKVVDFTDCLAGSLVTMLLADNGAEVVKVEAPGGDPMRAMLAWIMWNRGKKSAVLDLERPNGREAAIGLALQSDIVVENFSSALRKQLGLDYEALEKSNPGLIWCTITAFGPKGDYTDLPPYDGIVHAKAGRFVELQHTMNVNSPAFQTRPNASWGTANQAVQGIMAALLVRARTGKGQRVEVSMLQGLSAFDNGASRPRQEALGLMVLGTADPGRAVRAGGLGGVFSPRTKDGHWLQIAMASAFMFPNLMKALGLGWVLTDARYKGAPNQFASDEDRAALRRLILEGFLQKTADEWAVILRKHDVACGKYQTTQQFMDSEQQIHNGGVVEIEDPTVGKTKQIGSLVRFSKTPSVIGRPAPTLGEHTGEVLAMKEAAPRHTKAAVNRAAPLKNALQGITILDFASFLAAPLGASLMADLGARVIKIEPPNGDEFRYRNNLNPGRTFLNKESLVVDLKKPEGREIVHRLIAKADVLLHNMRADAPARIGIDYETASRINPRLVYVYAGSYGSSGPGLGLASFAPIVSAITGGTLSQVGKDREPPSPDIPLSIEDINRLGEGMSISDVHSADPASALAVGTAISMGLYARELTGSGQFVETFMINSNAYIRSEAFIRYKGMPPPREVERDLRGMDALQRMYKAAEGLVYLECRTRHEWEALCRTLKMDAWLKDQRFATPESRQIHDNELVAALGVVFREKTAQDWEVYMRAQGVPCVQADKQSYADFFLTDPTVRQNGYVVPLERQDIGFKMLRHGPPSHLSSTPGKVDKVRMFGEDGPSILAELGYSSSKIETLKNSGVINRAELAKVDLSDGQTVRH